MTHRVGGGLVLLLAVVSLLVVPRVLNPPAVDGAARIEPPDPPPAVGTCLVDQDTVIDIGPDGGLEVPDLPAPTSCSGEHAAEIFRVFAHVGPANLGGDDGPASVDEAYNACWDDSSLWSYIGAEMPDPADLVPGQWWSNPELTVSLTGPDATQRAHGARWVACAAGSPFGTLRQPLEGIVTVSGGVPPALSACYADRPDGSDSAFERIGCGTPHRAEKLATTTVFDEAGSGVRPVNMTVLESGCTALAHAATGRDLSVDPGITVEVMVYVWSDTGLTVTSGELPDVRNAQGGWADCTITVTDPDRALAGSLRLIGDAPLPWA